MIEKIECVIIKCDNCGEIFEDYNGYSIFTLQSDTDPADRDWHVDENIHYCPNCHTIDDDDNLIVKTETERK